MMERVILKTIGLLPESFFSLCYGFKPVVIDGQRLDSKARLLCDIDRKNATPVRDTPLETTRANLERLSSALSGPRPKLSRIEDIDIPTENGHLPARLYKPTTDPSLPVLVFYHGGGYIRGSLDSHDGLCARLAKYGGFAVLSVGYRLAPEARFPAAVEDAITAFNWAVRHGAEYGLDPQRVAVGGDSSGGCLAAAVAQQMSATGETAPVFQMLLYPTLDAHLSAASYKLFEDGFFLTYDRIRDYRDMYLNTAAERDDVRASPILNTDLAGLPPALIVTAGFDPLRDEAESYGKALQAAGVNVGIVRFPSMVHGFMSMTAILPQATRAVRQAAEALGHVFRGEDA
ncbi:alpha/beta hydrolase [uncultured Sneathiella sp.]|uniref:alpha/beta hydrolase n=1 Tax=uncultured Sneathiella sp. TaxID=879315 RepID=UPI0030EDE9E8|tara:strand:- start:48681 stop:49715 length:1035 start_codon:yes stop_codon:yes gene_type:complete